MNRRTVLATLGVLTAGLAGCTDSTGSPATDTQQSPASGTTTATDGGTATATDGGTTDSRFAGERCPSITDTTNTVCWHTVDPAAAGRYLEPSTELFEPSPGDGSVETIRFVLHNDSGETVGFNPYAWSVYRQTSSGWERVAPEMYPEPWYQLEDGLTYTWELALEEHPTTGADRTRYPVVDLDDGVYAFTVTVAAESGPNSGDRTECIALFEVQH